MTQKTVTTIPSAPTAPLASEAFYFPELQWSRQDEPEFPPRARHLTARSCVVDDMISGDIEGVCRVLAMNPDAGTSWDASKEIAHLIMDCVLVDRGEPIPRHLIDRGARDTDGMRHSAKLAWRALALLQTELENEAKL